MAAYNDSAFHFAYGASRPPAILHGSEEVQTLHSMFPDLPVTVLERCLLRTKNDLGAAVEFAMMHYADGNGTPGVGSAGFPAFHSGRSEVELRREQEESEAFIREEQLREAQRILQEKRDNEAAIRALEEADIAERDRIAREDAEAARLLYEQEREAADRLIQAREYTCETCMSEYPLPEMYILDSCNHRFCRECLRHHCVVKVTDGVTKDIKCMLKDCAALITYEEIHHIVDAITFAKYEDFLLRDTLAADKDVRFCPRPNCGVATISNPFNPMITCTNTACRFAFCRNCLEGWHADFTCAQYQAWKLENSEADARFAAWAALNTKECPNCHARIEKNGGCNHMTCRNPACKHEFCWLCSEKYISGHFSDKNPKGCVQFS